MTVTTLDELELPPAGSRWVVRRKVAVVNAVRAGRLSLSEALHRYGITTEEFAGWVRALDKIGAPGLRATRLQNYPELRGAGRG